MRTHRESFRRQVREHINESLLGDSEFDKLISLNELADDFHTELKWMKDNSNKEQCFKRYLSGLPTHIILERDPIRINLLLKVWFNKCGCVYNDPKDYEKEKQLYINVVSKELQRLFKKHQIQLPNRILGGIKMSNIYVIEANDQKGTIAFFDLSNGMRTNWVSYDGDEDLTEEIAKDFIEDKQVDFVSGEDLYDEYGKALYHIID